MDAALARTKKIKNNLCHCANLARPTYERQTTVAGVTVDTISANALVLTRRRGTLVYIFLTVHPCCKEEKFAVCLFRTLKHAVHNYIQNALM